MKKIPALILAAVLCFSLNLTFAEGKDTVQSAVARIETIGNDKVYLRSLGASDAVIEVAEELAKPHGNASAEWVITPDMDYTIGLLTSPENPMTDEGRSQIIRRTISGAAGLLSAKLSQNNMDACSYLSIQTVSEKTEANCLHLITYDAGCPVICSQWNDGEFCFITVSFISEDALLGANDEDGMRKLFSEYFPRCTCEKVR